MGIERGPFGEYIVCFLQCYKQYTYRSIYEIIVSEKMWSINLGGL